MGRSVSFVQCQTFDFDGNMFQEAITLGDVDNDSGNELCIGNINGDLAIFKGKGLKYTAKNLGMITCLGVGDIKNKGLNTLVVITGEGQCYLFDVPKPGLDDLEEALPLSISYKQRFPPNIKQLLIADVNNRGANDLCVILDTVVRSYTWEGDKLVHQDKHRHVCSFQVDAITVNYSHGMNHLVVCKPGEGLYSLNEALRRKGTQDQVVADISWEPVSHSVNLNTATDAIGNIRRRGGGENLVAFSTLDGVLKMYDGERQVWELPLENPIFSLAKTDIDLDGTDEVVACAWDGLTFFVDHDKNCVRFRFEDNVTIKAFCAGQYALSETKNLPSIVYVTFQGKIMVFYDVQLSSLSVKTLADHLDLSNEFPDFCNGEELSRQEHGEMVRNLLLGPTGPGG